MTTSVEAHFEAIATGFYLEGLLIDGDRIWYTDIGAAGVKAVGSDVVLLPERTMIGGLHRNADGALLIGGPGGIAWAYPDSQRAGTVLDGLNGVNELCASSDGGLIFGTIDLAAILRGERPGPSSIEFLGTDGRRSTLRGDLAFANGLALSADGRSLFFNESFRATRSFPVLPDDTIGEPATLIDMADCDGMALDIDGNVWVSGFASGELRCVSPSGVEVRRLALPGKACTNLRFGGSDLRDLYVTVVDPAAAQALAAGTMLTERSSTLFRTRSPVAGAPRAVSRLSLQ